MNTRQTQKPLEILLVEDNPGDVRLTQEALSDNRISCRLYVVHDGVEAMDFLHKKGNYSKHPFPNIILLDLNLPKKDGREVLKEIKENQQLKSIPVVVLTTSSHERDVAQAYEYHANCYIIKPLDIDQCEKIFKSIKQFWFDLAVLPPME